MTNPPLKLLPFQITCVEEMLSFLHKSGGCYNASEMGTGKSIQTIETINHLPFTADLKVLVICPAVMRLVWREEFQKWGGFKNLKVYKSKKQIGTDHQVAIVSYELAASVEFHKLLGVMKFDVLVIDEAHALKNPKAKRTKQILKHVWPKARYKICLSGTPFTNNVIDGFTLFNKLAPMEFPDFWSFANTYANRKSNGFGIEWVGLKNADKLRAIIKDKFFLRRRVIDVLPDLPEKTYKKITLDSEFAHQLSADEEKAMKQYREDLKRLLGKDSGAPIPPPPVAIMKIRKEQALKKVKPIVEYVRNLLEQEVPLVVFGIFRDALKEFEDAFKDYRPAVIHGDIKADDRQRGIERFQSGDTLLFIGQLTAAGVGITLTKSSNVVLTDFSYSPGEISQGCSRVARIGQKSPVTIHYFVAEGSNDEEIIKIVMDKAKNFAEILK